MKTRTSFAALFVSSVLCHGVVNAESYYDEILKIQFRQMAEECQLDIDQAIEAGRDAASLKDCYAHKVETTFAELKRQSIRSPWFYGTYVKLPKRTASMDRDNFLRAAIEADPILTLTAFNAALDGRLNVYYATEVASAYLPEQSDNLARIAIAHGAAPDRVTAATAAGRRNSRSP